jgi:hypothetical protein
MRAFIPACLLLIVPPAAFGASKPDTPLSKPQVTVLVDFEKPHSDVSLNAMRRALDDMLAPAGFSVDLQLRDALPPNAQFEELVVFKLTGSCTMSATAPMPVGALSDERGPLAMAYSSDGEILHFGEVECDRVRTSITRLLGYGSSNKSQNALGHALAMVVAHEIYHMLGNAKQHTHKGVTKSSLSPEDLLDGNLKLPPPAIETLDKISPLVEVPEP